jgi:3-mercaptopyruvate sulfurtransferase SseA
MFAKRILGAAAAAILLASSQAGAQTSAPLIVDADQLTGLIAREHPLILSTQSPTFEKGDEPGFLEGAVAANEDMWTAISRTQPQLDYLPSWNNAIGARGIGDRKRMVLIYDNGDLKFASRIRFLLAHYGVERAVLVNGGWPAILAQVQRGNLVKQPDPSIPSGRRYKSVVSTDPIAIETRDDLRKVVGPDGLKSDKIVLIDVRTLDEYIGKQVLPGIDRPGHIPGAVNLPILDLFASTHRLKDARQLRQTFHDSGIDTTKTLIFYCQDGARSSLGALAAVEASFPSVRLYYLSYLNWQSFADDPVIGPKSK